VCVCTHTHTCLCVCVREREREKKEREREREEREREREERERERERERDGYIDRQMYINIYIQTLTDFMLLPAGYISSQPKVSAPCLVCICSGFRV
jgi:hypothetical protein